MATEIDNKPRKPREIDLSKYKEGFFKYREDNDRCKYFATICDVNRLQKDPDFNVCEEFCIPNRDDIKTRKTSP